MENRPRRFGEHAWREGAPVEKATRLELQRVTRNESNAFARQTKISTDCGEKSAHKTRAMMTRDVIKSSIMRDSKKLCFFRHFESFKFLALSRSSKWYKWNFTKESARRILGSFAVPRITTLLFVICLFLQMTKTTIATVTTVSTVPDPEFVDEIGNITIAAGRNVKLSCSVKDLGTYKVAWMLFDKSAILTVHNHVITRNPRISVSHDKHRTWILHINNVQEDDKGKYMCQINTATAKTHYGYLNVVVPPDIDDSSSSSDAIVRESADVTLTCKATGSPKPNIRWKRDDNEKIAINKTLEVMEWEGETLEMSRISRLGMGVYLCIAANGIPPTVMKQIKVSVDFSPMLSIPHQLVGAPLGYSVTLECHTEAHPTSLNFWTRGDKEPMINDSKKYKTTLTPEKPSYKSHMTLTIYDIQMSDFGSYKCVAKNPRGETDGTIRLYMSTPPSTSPSTITTDVATKAWDELAEMNNSVDGNPSSLTFHNGKGSKQGKSGSNLNEVDKSEQKSGDLDRKRNYNWPPESDTATRFTTTGILLILDMIVTWIIR